MLTPRLTMILQLLAEGMVQKEIARELDMSQANVNKQIMQLFDKIGAINTTNAVAIAMSRKLIQYPRM